MQLLGSREGAPSGEVDDSSGAARAPAGRDSGGRAPAKPASNIADMDDDIPF
jgi:hypothetical protein